MNQEDFEKEIEADMITDKGFNVVFLLLLIISTLAFWKFLDILFWVFELIF